MKKNPLHNKQETGFKAPKDYFNSFEESLKAIITTEQFPKESGFKVPESYFNAIDGEKFTSKEKEVKIISLLNWKALSLVASVAAILIIMFGHKNNNNMLNFENIETVQIENYLLEEQISNEELAMNLQEETLTLDSFLELKEENIEDYLLENASIENLIIE